MAKEDNNSKNKQQTARKSLLSRLKDIIFRKRVKREQEKSVEWLRAKLDNFAAYTKKANQKNLMKKYDPTTSPLTGQMVMYIYDAKHKDILPFWDRAPLGIFMGPVPNKPYQFYSLNLHYLPPVLRAKFFDSLLDVLTTKTITEKSKLAITYDLLKSSQKYKYFKPAWKQYITFNVRSDIILIPPDEWDRVLFLESAQWMKASKETVYKWSRDQVK